jgi:hypothetical protein
MKKRRMYRIGERPVPEAKKEPEPLPEPKLEDLPNIFFIELEPMRKESRTVNKLYTQDGTSIDKRLKDGRTQLFQDKSKAEAFAKQTRSYPYRVINSNKELVGYGVPK